MREDWVRSQDRRRLLAAVGDTTALFGLAFLAVFLLGIWNPPELQKKPGIVFITLDKSEGELAASDLGDLSAPEKPLEAPAEAPAPSTAPAAPTTPVSRPAASPVERAPSSTAAAAPPATEPAPALSDWAPSPDSQGLSYAPSSEAQPSRAPASPASPAPTTPRLPPGVAPSSAPAARLSPAAPKPSALPPPAPSTQPQPMAPKPAAPAPLEPTPRPIPAEESAQPAVQPSREPPLEPALARASQPSTPAPSAERVPAQTPPAAEPPKPSASTAQPSQAAAAPVPVESFVPTTRTFGSKPAAASAAAPATPASSDSSSGPGVPEGTGTVVYRGTDKGNAYNTSILGAAGKVGRNMFVPIWLHMPLPSSVDDRVYLAIPADKSGYFSEQSRKEAFRRYYEKSGNAWRLRKQPPFEERDPIWNMLEEGGYDISKAEWRTDAKLQDMELSFVITPPSLLNRKATLSSLVLLSTSGNKEIDEAVLYGFKRGTYFNNTSAPVEGRFVYRFDSGPLR